MTKLTQNCLILRPNVVREAFELVARDLGFVHFETQESTGAKDTYEQIWATPNIAHATGAVNYVENPLVSFRYLFGRGADPVRNLERFAARLPHYTEDDLLNDAMNSKYHDEQVYAINRLAIGFVEFDPVVWTIIRVFATEAVNPLLREAAVNAIGFRAWAEFRPILEHIAHSDEAGNVRHRASLLLAHWP